MNGSSRLKGLFADATDRTDLSRLITERRHRPHCWDDMEEIDDDVEVSADVAD